MLTKGTGRFTWNRHQILFAALLLGVLAINLIPGLRASALYLIADGEKTTVLDGTAEISADRVIVVGAKSNDPQVQLTGGHKVTVTGGGNTQYATTRSGETVSDLLKRLEITVSPLEMVRVDLSVETVAVEVGADFTYYETEVQAAAYTTIYTPNYKLSKDEIEVIQPGQTGTREIVYEVTYADGQLVSRQVVEERNNTAVAELAYKGTLVDAVEAGDTIRSVVTLEDGSGYLIMASGNSLHFTGSMAVKCTAYTTGYDGVGTITATGTTVRHGTVAVDKNVIPLGTEMFITTASGGITYGMARAEDTGVRGAKIDLYMDSYDACIQFGVRNSVAYFLD